MKKVVGILSAAVISFALIGCGSTSEVASEETEEVAVEEEAAVEETEEAATEEEAAVEE